MKIDKPIQERWSKYIHLLLHDHGKTTRDVTTMAEVWRIAYVLNIPKEAYHIDITVNDDHIETALLRIFTHINR